MPEPTPTPLEVFYQEIRDIYEQNSKSKELRESFIRAGKDKACRIISRYKPRPNQRADVSITAESASVALPANFLSCTLGAIYKLKYNEKIEDSSLADITIDIYNKNTYQSVSSSRFTADGRVRFISHIAGIPVENTSYLSGFKIEIFANDSKGFSLWFDEDQVVSARTEKNFNYSGLHEITDTKDTITQNIRDIFIDICLKETLLEAARQVGREGNTTLSNLFLAQSKEYGLSLNDIAATVAAY